MPQEAGTLSFVISVGPIANAMGVPIAPLALLVAVEMLPDIVRTLGNVTLDVADLAEPATGRLISIPAGRPPALCDVFLRAGRTIEPGQPDEVLVSESFADRFWPGEDPIGRRVTRGTLPKPITIVGSGLGSPLYGDPTTQGYFNPRPRGPMVTKYTQQFLRQVEWGELDFLVLDQTRPDVEVPVVRVLVPGLRHFYRRFAPGRLYDVPVRLGLLDRPRLESELTPFLPHT